MIMIDHDWWKIAHDATDHVKKNIFKNQLYRFSLSADTCFTISVARECWSTNGQDHGSRSDFNSVLSARWVSCVTYHIISEQLVWPLYFCAHDTDSDRPHMPRRIPGPDQRADDWCQAKGSDAFGIRRRLYDEKRSRGRLCNGKVRVLRVLQV